MREDDSVTLGVAEYMLLRYFCVQVLKPEEPSDSKPEN